jgi:hypothetical protein
MIILSRYSVEKSEFEKTQTLDIPFPVQVKFLQMEPSAEVFLFVLADILMDNVLVFKYKVAKCHY